MAWYCVEEVRFRGRLLRVTLRYHCMDQGYAVLKGKPLKVEPDYCAERGTRERREGIRLWRIVERKHAGCHGPDD